MDEITIKKAKLTRTGTLEATYIDKDGNNITYKGQDKCHKDLRAALSALIPFFAELTEQREAQHINWECLDGEENTALLCKLEVTGIGIGGEEDNPRVTMTGRRTLFTTQLLSLTSPGIEIERTREWKHVEEFDKALA